ncbi:MAG: DoxX family protein [Acidobacteriota bacterium]|nr:DoxX family protein [Acidobacteriota bacterium]
MQHFEKLKPVAQLLLRLALAIIFIYHGYPKLFTERAQWLAAFPKMGFPGYFAYISGSLEFFGGCLLAVGLFTRIVALLLAGEMAIALWWLHFPRGMFTVGQYQLPLILCVSAFTLLVIGGGAVSADRLIFKSKD